MDTLSTLTLNPPPFPSPRELHTTHHLKLPPHHFPSKLPKDPSPFTSTSTTNKNPLTKLPLKHQTPPTPSSPPPNRHVHLNPATGYAVALLDVSRRKGTRLEALVSDVKKLRRLLRVKEGGGGVVVNVGMVWSGRFDGALVRLVRMLVKRGDVGMVGEVLVEFERIYDELCGTQVVVVSSKEKIGEDGLLGIAMRVKELSGAMKVKVRNFVCEESPFAVA